MRTLKFRQRAFGDRWHYWGYVNGDNLSFTSPISGLASEQYTGLNDANGTEIYEGDIVEYDFGHTGYVSGIIRTPVIFEGGCFVTESCLLNLNDYPIVVIGNTYEGVDGKPWKS